MFLFVLTRLFAMVEEDYNKSVSKERISRQFLSYIFFLNFRGRATSALLDNTCHIMHALSTFLLFISKRVNQNVRAMLRPKLRHVRYRNNGISFCLDKSFVYASSDKLCTLIRK